MAYRIGQRIEVLDNFPGVANSYHNGTVVGNDGDNIVVTYETLYDNQGNLLTQQIPFDNIRPYPDGIQVQFSLGESVDAWYNNAWWRGRLRRFEPNHEQEVVYRVRFDQMLDGEQFRTFRREHIRMHQEFGFHEDIHLIADWAYHRMYKQ